MKDKEKEKEKKEFVNIFSLYVLLLCACFRLGTRSLSVFRLLSLLSFTVESEHIIKLQRCRKHFLNLQITTYIK